MRNPVTFFFYSDFDYYFLAYVSVVKKNCRKNSVEIFLLVFLKIRYTLMFFRHVKKIGTIVFFRARTFGRGTVRRGTVRRLKKC